MSAVSNPVLARLPGRPVEVIWADKVAAFLAMGWLGLMIVAWLIAIMACGLAGANLLAKDTAALAVEAGLAIVFPIWIALTGLDRLFHGPARRLARPH
jgi:hypothetical protein